MPAVFTLHEFTVTQRLSTIEGDNLSGVTLSCSDPQWQLKQRRLKLDENVVEWTGVMSGPWSPAVGVDVGGAHPEVAVQPLHHLHVARRAVRHSLTLLHDAALTVSAEG